MVEPLSAIVAGHLCLDIIPDLTACPPGNFQAMFLPGRLLNVGPATFSTGGAVSNTGLVLHKLGINTRLMGKVGNDAFGRAVQQVVSAVHPSLADGMIVDPAASTSYTLVINPPDIDRIFLHCPGANDTFTAADIRYPALAAARLFHFGYPPLMKLMYANRGAELVEIFRRAKQTGVTTSLDMALPDPTSEAGQADWPHIVAAVLPYVDIFLPSLEEILYMTRRETYQALSRAAAGPNFLPLVTPGLLSEVSEHLLEMGPKVVGLKLGHRGLYLRTAGQAAIEAMGRAGPVNPAAWANREMWTPCFEVNVVGTTGSGDATIAGFLAALLRNMPPAAAITAAVAVGACNVEAADALGGIRPWEDTMARVAAGWPRRSMLVNAPGWTVDAAHGVWFNPR